MPLVDYPTNSSAAILRRVECKDDRRRIIMNLKLFGRELSWSKLRYYPGIFLEGPKKTTKISVGVAGVSTENRTQRLIDRSLILCHGTEANGIDYSFAGSCHRFLFARRKQTASLWVGNHQERETLTNFKYAVICFLHLNENAASMYYAHVVNKLTKIFIQFTDFWCLHWCLTRILEIRVWSSDLHDFPQPLRRVHLILSALSQS